MRQSWRGLVRGRVACAVALLLGVAAVWSASALLAPPALGAEEGAGAPGGGLEEELATEPKTEGPKGETAGEAPKSQSFLGWLYGALKLRYTLVFLFITFNMIALMVMNGMALRRDSVVPPELIEQFDAQLNEKRYQEAYELVKADESFLAKVLTAGMTKLSAGYDGAVETMQQTGEEETMKLDHRMGYIALCAQIAPMFGLLGTVDGMVQTFDVIARSNTTPKPNELAQGIGTALVTTVVGLMIAIPALIYYQIVRNRQVKLLREAGLVTDVLMKRFSGLPAAAVPAPVVAQAPAPAAPAAPARSQAR